jgi:signal transduction histidine kinase
MQEGAPGVQGLAPEAPEAHVDRRGTRRAHGHAPSTPWTRMPLPLTRRFLATGGLLGLVMAGVLAVLIGHETYTELFEERERTALLCAREVLHRGAAAPRAVEELRRVYGGSSLVLLDVTGQPLVAAPATALPEPALARRWVEEALVLDPPGEDPDPPRYSELFGVQRDGSALRTLAPLPGLPPPGYVVLTQPVADLLPEAIGAGLEAGAQALVASALLIACLALWMRRSERQVQARTADLAAANAHLDDLREGLERMVSDRTSRLLQAETLARLGRLSASVAHEINNPLAAIAAAAEALLLRGQRTDLPRDFRESFEAYLPTIRDEAFRVEEVARGLLDLSRLGASKGRELVELRRLLEATELLLSPRAAQVGQRIRIDAPTDAVVSGDPTALRQVVLNLTLNALQASPVGGEVRWTVADAGDEWRLCCQDDGTGFSDEALARGLEPFFTEKAVGEGTGLGLSVAQGVIRDHGGRLQLSNTARGGAQVELHLPRVGRGAS